MKDAMTRTTLLLVLAGIVSNAGAEAPRKAADLFQTSKIWNVHLKFSAGQWAAIEPKGGAGLFGGPGGPGGPGGGFGIATMLAPAFLKGDTNGDHQLSAAEFSALGDGWFAAWDTQKAGALGADELRAGSGTLFEAGLQAMMGGRGPGGFGGAMGLVAPKGKRNGVAGMSGIDFEYVHAGLDFDGQTFADVAVRYKGNGTYLQSRDRDKKSFKIDLSEYHKDLKLAGVTKLNLHSGVTDASMMNEVLSHRLYRDAGLTAPRSSYARVYVTVAGKHERKYFGLYSLVEELDNAFALEHYKTKEGLFLKPATRDIFGYLGEDWEPYDQPYSPKGKPTPAQQKRVIDLARLVSKGSDEDFRARAGEYLNIEQMARYLAVTVWLSTLDSILGMGQNYYVYLHPATNKFEFLPWDLDHSFGQFPMGGTQEQRENLSLLQPWQGQIRFLERVYALPEFRKIYLARMAQYQESVFEPARFSQQVDELAKVIRPAVLEESAKKLERFDQVVAGESVAPESFGFGPPGGGGPGGPPPGGGGIGFGGGGGGGIGFGGRGGAVKPIKAFVGPRAQSVRDQLAGKSQGMVRTAGGFGRPGGGGPVGPGRGPSLDRALLDQFDTGKNGSLSQAEFRAGFARWFAAWNGNKSGQLTSAQLSEGINRDLNPFRGPRP